MRKVNIFLLLPETEPSKQWMCSNELWSDENSFSEFVNELVNYKNITLIENYTGFYDLLNVINFLEHYIILEDLYPQAPQRRFKKILYEWDNWREKRHQSDLENYFVFNQTISDHSFCEIAARKKTNANDKYALLNHHACAIYGNITVLVERDIIEFDNIFDENTLRQWFCNNRIPSRKFHKNPKHGENGRGNFPGASPLMCNSVQAQQLLNLAIGEVSDKLFYLDTNHDMVIVFKSENEPLNQYHGYHVCKTSSDIPNEIKKWLQLT